MADPVNVLRVDEELSFDELGKPVEKMRVQFKVGVHGPFYRRYPKEGFSSAFVKGDLEQFARELATLKE